MKSILLIFIKNPRRGHVKTRLAHTVGDTEALRIYKVLLEKTRNAALGVDAERWLFYSEKIDPGDAWQETEFKKFVQQGSGLGARMEHAFEQAFAATAARVLIIGSDCPLLSGSLLWQAFAALDEHDCVLGPTPDGGYYLLGMKTPEPALFRGIEWSTDTVRAHTLEKMRAQGLSCALLPVLTDVDTEEDWRAVEGKM